MALDFTFDSDDNNNAVIKVIGVGGAGDEMPPAGTTGPAEARYDDSARAIKQGEEGEA